MLTFGPHIDGFHDVGDQVIADLRRRARAHFRRREEERAALTSVAAFEARRDEVRARFLDAIGGLPGPDEPGRRTPLGARVTGVVERPAFTIEKLIYESLPGFLVTAACYVPKGLTGRAPAVVFAHGHSDQSKAYPPYQAVCSDLAESGFVVLAVDPIGQGERFGYLEGGERRVGPSTVEHTHAGWPFFLRGASIARHFVWDLMRGVDYLGSRPDVDPSRIGMTGTSGGGTQTCFTMLCEPRLAAAVPCTFVSTLEAILKTGQAQDAEQIVPGCIAAGPDHDDFLAAMAPRPVLVGAVAGDFFPIEGTHEAVRRARRVYALYGREQNLGLVVDPARHAYTPGLRQACVNWFKRHLKGEPSDFVTGQPPTLPAPALWATPSGQIGTDFGSALTAFDLNRDELPPPPLPAPPAALRARLADVLGVDAGGDRSAPIHPRIIKESVVEGRAVEKIWFFSAPDIAVAGVLAHPRAADTTDPRQPRPAAVLLLENGTQDAPGQRALLESLLDAGRRVFIFDPRGVGAVASRPLHDETAVTFFDTEYRLGCNALMLGLSLLGLRVFDVLRAFDYLRTRPDVASVEIRGIGSGALWAFFAAALEEGFAALTCEGMLCSYRDVCETRYYDRDLLRKTLAPGMLRQGDIADWLPCLAPRPVTFVRPRDASGAPLDAAAFHERRIKPLRARGGLPGEWQPAVM